MPKGIAAVLLVCFALAGCSSVSEIPYPDLSEITPAKDPSLSEEERSAMIEDLKQEQATHKASATAAIENR